MVPDFAVVAFDSDCLSAASLAIDLQQLLKSCET
jgi:hypothetical protein